VRPFIVEQQFADIVAGRRPIISERFLTAGDARGD
jgi:hypothetical protein